MPEWEGLEKMVYVCVRCGAQVKGEELILQKIRCPKCRYRVLRKIRPPIVKRIKAV